MSSFTEKLTRVYSKDTETPLQSTSWIPKRKFSKGDIIGQIKAVAGEAKDLSPYHAQEILDESVLLSQCRDTIFSVVADHLLKRYGQENFDRRLDHFEESWKKMHAKFGDDLILGLADLIDCLETDPFVNFDGYLNKEIVKAQMAAIRSKSQKSVGS